MLLATKDRVRASDLALAQDQRSAGGAAAPTLEEMSLEDMEKFLIQKAMARYQGKAAAAAEALGLSRSAFYRRLQQYGL